MTMPNPPLAKTPVYGLEYVPQGYPARGSRLALERAMATIEAALIAGGVAAAGASDILAVSGRVSTLENTQDAAPVTSYALHTAGGAVSGFTVMALAQPAAADDPYGFWKSATPSRLTVPAGRGGLYELTGVGGFVSSAATVAHFAEVRVNGVTVPGSGTSGMGTSVNHLLPLPVRPRRLVAGDYVELALYSSAATTASSSVGQTPALYLKRLGA